MRGVVSICFLLRIYSVFGQNNVTDFREVDYRIIADDYSRIDYTEMLNEMRIGKMRSFLVAMMDWAFSAREYLNDKSGENTLTPPADHGRKLKYKSAEIKFIMKTLLIFKVFLGLIIPLGVMASKILSWKAVTLSLMAFMLAKILFIKNLLSGKSTLSVTPSNFVQPYVIHGGPNDLFWKRYGETQNAFS